MHNANVTRLPWLAPTFQTVLSDPAAREAYAAKADAIEYRSADPWLGSDGAWTINEDCLAVRDGADGEHLRFTREGLNALCRHTGYPMPAVTRILRSDPALAMDVLQATCTDETGVKGLEDRRIVVDDGAICGIVSKTYTAYPHRHLLDYANGLHHPEHFRSLGGTVHGTDLRLDLLHEERPTLPGGDDLIQFGIELSNSMTGNRAVHIGHLVHRLVCRNGMRGLASDRNWRIRHQGAQERFQELVRRMVEEAERDAERVRELIETLARVPVSPEWYRAIAEDRPANDATWNAVTGLKHRVATKLELDENTDAIDDQMAMIAAMPRIAGDAIHTSHFRSDATMWDWLNGLTAAAREQAPPMRQEAEHRCGEVAHHLERLLEAA